MILDFETALTLLKERISIHLGIRPLVVSIDGRAASGKTTFAKRLSSEMYVSVIHTDDFFRPRDEFGNLNISEFDGNFDIKRFRDEIISNLNSDKTFSYGKFDCKSGKIVEYINCGNTSCYVVEGSYSQNPRLGNYADIKLFFDIDKKMQEERIILRNGKTAFENYKNIWIPAEERYFKRYDIESSCDITVVSKEL